MNREGWGGERRADNEEKIRTEMHHVKVQVPHGECNCTVHLKWSNKLNGEITNILSCGPRGGQLIIEL